MADRNIKHLVTEAVSLDREIKKKAERLKVIMVKLVEAARVNDQELLPTGGGGTRWMIEGNDGCVAGANFPALSLKSEIEGAGNTIEKIKDLTGAVFSRLFVPAISFKPGVNFCDAAAAMLPKADVSKLIKLCQCDSAPRVSFDFADRTIVAAKSKAAVMPYKNNVGPQVRRRRYALGWSQSILAAKLQIEGCDISRSGVSKIESRFCYVNDKSIMFLSEVLKVSCDQIFPKRDRAKRFLDFMSKLESTRF